MPDQTKLDLNEKTQRRNKEESKKKLMAAAGEAIRLNGDKKIYNTTIARLAGVDRKLIRAYFTSLEGLLEAYAIEHDYWLSYARELEKDPKSETVVTLKDTIITLLINQFLYFYECESMQRLILMEIGGKSKLMSSISRIRESKGDQFLEAADQYFQNAGIDIRAMVAITVGGVYYTVLHSRNNDSTFCGLDLKYPDARDRIISALRTTISLAFDAAEARERISQG